LYIKKRTILIFTSIIVLIFSAAGVYAATTQSSNTNTIYACQTKGDNLLRVVDANTACKNNETVLSWNVIGPKGDKGDTGAAGPKGDTGAVGATGSQGPKGDTGATGVTGTAGPQGPAGVDGAVGPQGIQGPKGDTGAQGPVGPIGPQGLEGKEGVQGFVGATGLQGPQGLPGVSGAQGLKGDKGDPGPAGGTDIVNGKVSIIADYTGQIYDITHLGTKPFTATSSIAHYFPIQITFPPGTFSPGVKKYFITLGPSSYSLASSDAALAADGSVTFSITFTSYPIPTLNWEFTFMVSAMQ
jgi:hypothetical protein